MIFSENRYPLFGIMLQPRVRARPQAFDPRGALPLCNIPAGSLKAPSLFDWEDLRQEIAGRFARLNVCWPGENEPRMGRNMSTAKMLGLIAVGSLSRSPADRKSTRLNSSHVS